jgi:hypothetical protein
MTATIRPRVTGEDAQRIFVVGATGSGKTTLAVELASGAARAVWLDVKGDNAPGWPAVQAASLADLSGLDRAAHLDALLNVHGQHLVVQLATRPDLKDADQLDAVAEAAYELCNVLLVVDDAMGVVGTTPPYYLNRVLGMGRSRGVGCMTVAVKAHHIPRDFLNQAEHVIAFEVSNEDDIERLTREASSAFRELPELRRFEYIWYDREQRIAQRFEPLTPSARAA